MLIPGFEVLSITNGKFRDLTIHKNKNLEDLDKSKTITTKSYMVPILSGVLGSLIPGD